MPPEPETGSEAPDPAGPADPNHRPVPSDDARNLAMLSHLVGAVPVVGVLAALLIWLLRKDAEPFVDAHGKEALNFQLTLAGLYVVLFALSVITFGYLAIVIRPLGFLLWLASLGLIALAARAAKGGQSHLYPITLRPLQ
jgi:uncharacterized Tic20 family protein